MSDLRRTTRRTVPLAAAGWHLVLVTLSLVTVFPLLWAILTSFKPANEVFDLAPVSAHPTIANYTDVLTRWPAAELVGRTAVMATGVAVGQLVIAVLAAFALAHARRRARSVVLLLTTVSLAIPPQALIVPQFLLAARLGWLNTEAGLIVPQLGSSALAVLVMLQHVEALPPSLTAAARLEGARPHEVLWHVVLPGLRPAIAALGILVFITTWNEYLWPLLITPDALHTTVQVGLAQFETAEGINYGGLLAAATLTSLPIVVVYFAASRRITDAFLTSGLR
ncbi:carbohydrate ABC transporter permease [Kribbella sp. NPDC050241]|uniref:carbohydrate ABC transporter permease n=1 Tax=Kribbella sp. NPDC050241 TaxID=3364115 RepID=UPI0037999672